jgi:hypothetical protein
MPWHGSKFGGVKRYAADFGNPGDSFSDFSGAHFSSPEVGASESTPTGADFAHSRQWLWYFSFTAVFPHRACGVGRGGGTRWGKPSSNSLASQLPLSRPALVTLFLFTFIGEWNDSVQAPCFTTRPELRTVQLALAEFQEQFTNNWSLLMAAVVIATLPVVVVFLLGQRQFIQGIATTGIKN